MWFIPRRVMPRPRLGRQLSKGIIEKATNFSICKPPNSTGEVHLRSPGLPDRSGWPLCHHVPVGWRPSLSLHETSTSWLSSGQLSRLGKMPTLRLLSRVTPEGGPRSCSKVTLVFWGRISSGGWNGNVVMKQGGTTKMLICKSEIFSPAQAY